MYRMLLCLFELWPFLQALAPTAPLCINYIGHNRSQFTDGYTAQPAAPTVIPPDVPYASVHMAVHTIVEHPNQEGDTFAVQGPLN